MCSKIYALFSFFFFVFLFLSCTSGIKMGNSGLLIHSTKIYDSASNTYKAYGLFPDIKIWYQDSMLIQEIKQVARKHSNGKEEITQFLHHYLLVDLKKRHAYEYSSFSDTARLFNSYPTNRPEGIGGINFFGEGQDSFTKAPLALPDTIINSISYKRYLVQFVGFHSKGSVEEKMIVYTNCSSKHRIFRYFKESQFGDECPETRIDYVPSKSDPIPFSIEFTFVRDELTSEELRVFNNLKKRIKSIN